MTKKLRMINPKAMAIIFVVAASIFVFVLPQPMESGIGDIWISCRISGGNYAPGQSVKSNTWWCCCLDGNAGWRSSSPCSYPENKNTCAAGNTYFADRQLVDCTYVDRTDNICRASNFHSSCTAPSFCAGVTAGTTPDATSSSNCDDPSSSTDNIRTRDGCSSTCQRIDSNICDAQCNAAAACDGIAIGNQGGCSAGYTCDTTCTCNTGCQDTDGGRVYTVGGTCTDPTSHQDSCSGSTLTEYYCSLGTCASTPKDCNDDDDYYCDISNPNLRRRYENWYCADTNPDKCDYSTSTANTYVCDASMECNSQSCEGTTYRCYYSNAGAYNWATSYLLTETACSDGHDNDCDGLCDTSGCGAMPADPDCSAGCICGDWSNNGCGLGICLETEMQQTRPCTPTNCDEQTQCNPDPSCIAGPITSFNFNIYKGWNLISSPFASITDVQLDTCGALTGNFYFYNSVTGKWVINTVGIRNLQGGISYWFYSTKACRVDITGSGDVLSTNLAVNKGWNQIGSPTDGMADISPMASSCMNCGDNVCSSIKTLWYDPVTKLWFEVTSLEPGKGYSMQCID